MWQLCYLPRWATVLIVVVLLFSSSCTLFSPPPPPPEPENNPPVVHVMAAEKHVFPATSSQIVCAATDADGDDLEFRWSANGGMIRGTGDNVTWIAPEVIGKYTIEVMVTDGKGGEAVDSLSISVTPNNNTAPVISSPEGEQELVRRFTTTSIECIAEDTDGDELSYSWSATGGTIKGEGANVEWIAPGSGGDQAVTVTVSDGKGGEAKASVYFRVRCCG